MLRFTAALTTLISVLVISAPQALAACTGRPGASAIEQYCEAIPDGTGERPGPSSKSTAKSGSGVPEGTSRQLQNAGQDGQAVLGIVAASGGSGAGGPSSGSGGKSATEKGQGSAPDAGEGVGESETTVVAAKSPSDNPLRAVSSAVSNGATVGSAFLWGLLALTVVGAGVAWVGFRRNRTPTPDE